MNTSKKEKEVMNKSINIRHHAQRRMLVRIAVSMLMMFLISAPGLMIEANAEADSAHSKITCGYDSICNTISEREFDLILYSSLGSEMVILYSREKVEAVVADASEKYYSRSTGNVRDAIYFLSRHTDYTGFKFRQARKSKGLFSSKVVNGVYVAVPEYRSEGDHKSPEYRFTEKDGKLTVRIRPVIRPMSN